MTDQEAEIRAQRAEVRAREAEARARDAEARGREADARAREVEAKIREMKARARATEIKIRMRKAKPETLSHEQKRELSVLIGQLNEVYMDGVVEIIRAGLPQLQDTKEEIEIDIDTIDDITLSRLYNFVKSAINADTALQA